MSTAPVRLGVIGCGDVAFRTYLPGLVQLGPDVKAAGISDARRETAERVAAFSPAWSAETAAFTDIDDLFAQPTSMPC